METSECEEIPTDNASSIQNCPLRKRVRMNSDTSVSPTRITVMMAHMGTRASQPGIRSSKFGNERWGDCWGGGWGR